MKLYTLKSAFGTYINRIQSIDTSDNLPFSGGEYNDHEDFTEIINKLQFRLERDVNEKKMTSDFLYQAIDFYYGPIIIKSDQEKTLHFFSVSPKLKTLLEQLKLPKHKFYPIVLNIDNGIDLSYYILQIDDNMTSYMDYNKSTFYGLNLISDELSFYQEGEIKSEENLLGLLDDDIFPYDKSMSINQELDWVYMAPFFMISEKSKQLLEGNGIVGMEITPFYEVESDYGKPNDLGYLNKFGGREIIINGKSTMDDLDIDDFPRADKK
ncbi:hypothetical protein KHA90_21690 [Flavobacterium psychroterrae]|uniref:Uncharacterized protein n=1 Tax=Flavobacterium psychroterrae TaxID=2133767 RepID=A0ABS5PIW3_9FLAO|nr:hypothetical protein [Flavobacterium psychroterrae]MBS7233631.1 hypothetical protein [Flavobacterium psychroterrae]